MPGCVDLHRRNLTVMGLGRGACPEASADSKGVTKLPAFQDVQKYLISTHCKGHAWGQSASVRLRLVTGMP